jgi:DUF4097 and DUF4098 domain-containing protein YvlB
MRKILIPAFAASLLCLTACDIEDLGSFERYNRDFHYSYPLKEGGRLSVETFNGAVEISAWGQDTVDISGTKYGPSQEAADALKIEVSNSSDTVSIRAVRPSERRNNQGARFVIKVPRGAVLDRIITSNGGVQVQDGMGPARVRTSNGQIRIQTLHGSLDAQTSNGAVELLDVEGNVTARTSNGRIHADGLRGSLDATTSNGGVDANLARADHPVRVETNNGHVDLTLPVNFSQDVHVSTSNGPITLRLPEHVNAHVLAQTSNSSVTTDFELRVQGEFTKHRMEGTIGNGGPMIDLSTSNGAIRLVKM